MFSKPFCSPSHIISGGSKWLFPMILLSWTTILKTDMRFVNMDILEFRAKDFSQLFKLSALKEHQDNCFEGEDKDHKSAGRKWRNSLPRTSGELDSFASNYLGLTYRDNRARVRTFSRCTTRTRFWQSLQIVRRRDATRGIFSRDNLPADSKENIRKIRKTLHCVLNAVRTSGRILRAVPYRLFSALIKGATTIS